MGALESRPFGSGERVSVLYWDGSGIFSAMIYYDIDVRVLLSSKNFCEIEDFEKFEQTTKNKTCRIFQHAKSYSVQQGNG